MPEPDQPPRPERSRPPGGPEDRPATPRPAAQEASVDLLGSSRPATQAGEGHPDESAEPKGLPNLGEKIDEFRLVESIGAGGMGAVFRAIDLGLDRQVALKILPPEQAVDPEVVRRYHQEGRAAARLDHENIARVYTIGDDGRYHYIAFEYIEGVTIRQKVIREGPLPVPQAVDVTLQIARALTHAAEREVVHRDIKPSNIIITPGGRAKLVDMGLARQFERRSEADLTQTGMTLGTFDYISPEQAADPRGVDIRGDLYSLGCTLFHMLAGRPPFPEGTVLQKLLQHREEAPPDIRRLNPSVPESLASILGKLLVKDREHRYQTPEHLARDLGAVAGRRTIKLASRRETPNWARHLFWGGPGLVFLLLLAGMVWWGDGPTAPAPPGFGGGGAIGPPVAPFPPGPFVPRAGGLGAAPAALSKAGEARPTPEPIAPREVAVGPTDDLVRILAEAPPRSTILLAERGPYELQSDRPIRLDRGDVTVRAEAGVRPVIRLAARDLAPIAAVGSAGGPTAPAVAALVDIRGGRATFDGIDFLVDPAGFESTFGGDRPAPGVPARVLAAIAAEDAELVVRRCSFRRVGGAPASSPTWRAAAIRFHATTKAGPTRGAGDPAVASLVVDASDFDGHQVGLLASGPVEVSCRDVAFGPTLAEQASVWVDNPDAAATPAEFRLDHVSGLLGAGPMFRFAGSAPRVLIRRSAFGPVATAAANGAEATPTLVAIDVGDRLAWRGGENLFARLGTFLRPGGARPQAAIRAFDAWADDPGTFREAGSAAYDGAIWERLPITSQTPTSPESPRSYRLTLPRSVAQHPGARWGPAGPLPPPTWLAASNPPNRVIPLAIPGRAGPPAAAGPAAPTFAPVPTPRRPTPEPEPPLESPDGLTPMPMPPEPDRSPLGVFDRD